MQTWNVLSEEWCKFNESLNACSLTFHIVTRGDETERSLMIIETLFSFSSFNIHESNNFMMI